MSIEEQAEEVDKVKRSENGVITDPFSFSNIQKFFLELSASLPQAFFHLAQNKSASAFLRLGLTYYLLPRLHVEYEYVFCDGQLDFDKISGGMKRKNMLRIDFENLVVAITSYPCRHPHLLALPEYLL